MSREYKNIIFNDIDKRYEIDGSSLTCGTQLEMLLDGEDYKARVEYSDNYDRGYYAILFQKDGDPFNKSLEECWAGRFID